MRSTANLLVYLLLSWSLIGHGRSDSDRLFSVTLHAPSAAIKSGEEVPLRVTVTNISDHTLRFGRTPGIVPHEELSYQIEIRDALGKEPSLTPFFQHLKQNPASTWGSYTTYSLEPGKSFDDEVTITKLYALTRRGQYRVSVARGQDPLEKSGKGIVQSNSIILTVIP
jgi:hypothetical protein